MTSYKIKYLLQQQYRNQTHHFVLSRFPEAEQWRLVNYCCNSLLISKAPLSPSAFKICSKYPLCLFGYGEGQGWQANNHFSFYCRHLLFQIPSPFPSLQGFQQCAIPQLRHWGIQTLVDRPSHLGWVWVQGRQENKLDLAFHRWVQGAYVAAWAQETLAGVLYFTNQNLQLR